MKKVIVTGGAGFIGSHLVDALVGRGFDVHVIDNLSSGKRKYINKKAHFHDVDIRNLDKLTPIFEGGTYVFHVAALPSVQYSIENPIETNEVNVGGTLNVLHAALDGGVRKVIYSASCSAYGDQTTFPLREDMLVSPQSPYGLQKYIGELYCRVFSEVYRLPTISLRYFNVYGSRHDPEGSYAFVIGKFLQQFREGKPMTITGDGEQTRDFIHVRDVVHANLLAMENEKMGSGEVINIGDGNNVSINELARLIGGPIEYISPRIEPKHTQADNTKARKLLGWEPKVPFEEGISALREMVS